MAKHQIITLSYQRCGASFEAARKRRGRHSRFCSPECRAAARAERRATYLAQGRYLFGVACLVCGRLFDAYYRHSQTCSPRCAGVLKSRSRRKMLRSRRAAGDLFDAVGDGGE
jgi:hypothetical protein